MKTAPRTFERLVWGILLLTLMGIAGAFIWSRMAHRDKPLPIYGRVPPFTLTNQLGQPISLSDLSGDIWLADIIFTRCPGTCPRMSQEMASLQKALGGRALRLVSLTADPAYDTPEILKRYAKRYDATPGKWLFLTGEKTNVYRLALDGLKLAVEENKPSERTSVNDLFIHSTIFTLVDGRGQIRGFFQGLEPEAPRQIQAAVRQLQQEPP